MRRGGTPSFRLDIAPPSAKSGDSSNVAKKARAGDGFRSPRHISTMCSIAARIPAIVTGGVANQFVRRGCFLRLKQRLAPLIGLGDLAAFCSGSDFVRPSAEVAEELRRAPCAFDRREDRVDRMGAAARDRDGSFGEVRRRPQPFRRRGNRRRVEWGQSSSACPNGVRSFGCCS